MLGLFFFWCYIFSMATILYRIYDPRIPEATRYYGITESTLKKRFYEHLRLARIGKKRMPVLDWIRKLQAEEIQPSIEALATFETRAQGNVAEREHIANGRALGYKLLNLADGGEGGRQPKEVLERVRATKKQQAKNNIEYYKKLAETGHLKMRELRSLDPTWEQERIEAIQAGIKQGQRSETQRQRMQEKPELREQLSLLHKGKPRKGFGRRHPVSSSEGLEFDTVKAAAEYYQVSVSKLSKYLQDTKVFFVDGKPISITYKNPEDAKERHKKRRIKSSEGLEFPSIAKAAQHYNADWVTIQRAIKNKKAYKSVTFSFDLV
jgi:hypothetical protein